MIALPVHALHITFCDGII